MLSRQSASQKSPAAHVALSAKPSSKGPSRTCCVVSKAQALLKQVQLRMYRLGNPPAQKGPAATVALAANPSSKEPSCNSSSIRKSQPRNVQQQMLLSRQSPSQTSPAASSSNCCSVGKSQIKRVQQHMLCYRQIPSQTSPAPYMRYRKSQRKSCSSRCYDLSANPISKQSTKTHPSSKESSSNCCSVGKSHLKESSSNCCSGGKSQLKRGQQQLVALSAKPSSKEPCSRCCVRRPSSTPAPAHAPVGLKAALHPKPHSRQRAQPDHLAVWATALFMANRTICDVPTLHRVHQAPMRSPALDRGYMARSARGAHLTHHHLSRGPTGRPPALPLPRQHSTHV